MNLLGNRCGSQDLKRLGIPWCPARKARSTYATVVVNHPPHHAEG
ncbi:MAG: hypothetical protein ACLSHC_15030 [Bilophila wadsworthia]